MNEKKEYIERGALMEEIRKHIETIGANAERLVARFPAADVEPVVRCRDCENGYIPSSSGSYVWCKMFNQSLPFDFHCKHAQEETVDLCNECEYSPSLCGMDVEDCAHMERSGSGE